MEGRRWEDLDEDRLLNVLGRVGMESLILDVHFVSKSWHRAKLKTSSQFIKLIVDRSCGNATVLIPPHCCLTESFLKILGLYPILCLYKISVIPGLEQYWRNLEGLILGMSNDMRAILTQICLNCKNFSWVCMDREYLVIILQGCKELVYLGLPDCVGFNVDTEILKLTSYISTFKYGCSTAKPNDDDG
ncbi:hypothetical protein KPL70_026116 [Citrus sinensis]|uniref:F-box domain-containing protein n=1 Tax=Citrus clementina TaxID=85681 RepID=V4SB74_CITCL|nr:hypothetical protein CICLE_v10007089mg [Citrus x clementina]KAH9649798.1 hypothetical protein KPL70_026116 [Citrus sinensis]